MILHRNRATRPMWTWLLISLAFGVSGVGSGSIAVRPPSANTGGPLTEMVQGGIGVPLRAPTPHRAAVTILRTVRVGTEFRALAVDGQTGRIFVLTHDVDPRGARPPRGIVTTLDATTGRLVGRVAVGPSVQAVAVDERRNRVYVTSYFDRLYVLDAIAGTLLYAIRITPPSEGLAVDEQTGHVVIGDGNGVDVLDAIHKVLLHSTMTTPGSEMVVVDSNRRRAVTNHCPHENPSEFGHTCASFLDLDTGRLVATVPVTGVLYGIGMDSQDGHTILADGCFRCEWNEVRVLDTQTARLVHFDTHLAEVTGVLAVDATTSRAFAVTVPDGDELNMKGLSTDYAATVDTFDSHTGRHLARQVAERKRGLLIGLAVAVDGRRGCLYVATQTLPAAGPPSEAGILRIFTTRGLQLVGRVSVGHGPHRLAVDQASGHVFVTNELDGTVSTLSGCPRPTTSGPSRR